MIGVTLDSPSDSWVPTHGATSVPSMPTFPGNPILLYYSSAASPIFFGKYYIKRGLLPQPVVLPILSLFLILFIGCWTRVVVSPKLSLDLPYRRVHKVKDRRVW